MPFAFLGKVAVQYANSHCASIGASPAAAFMRIPYRCQITSVDGVAHGTITTADCSVAVALNGTAIPGSPLIIPLASAAPGEVASFIPASPTSANDGDIITFTPSGASGAGIPATFSVGMKAT